MAIDYHRDLNPAQFQAATTLDGPVLVIAGAGSGKTRTVVYRLARLVEAGVDPGRIVLLTFTRKAAAAMLHRAAHLLGQGLGAVRGGTFHAFAYGILRRHAERLGYPQGVTILDATDAESLIAEAKDHAGVATKDKRFPKRATLAALFSRCRNKEITLEEALAQDYHLQEYQEELTRIAAAYAELKRRYGVMDYDDLLFELERLLTEHPDVRQRVADAISHVMVDEYQDTNRVQARLVRLLFAPEAERPNLMAVGDDAQSIYGFRGADVRNILDFPRHWPGAVVIKLEQNYRSTQPILGLANHLLAGFRHAYAKHLFSTLEAPQPPALIRAPTDRVQAALVRELLHTWTREGIPLAEMAVLFRAGYQSFQLEVELAKAGIPFRKYGGMRFAEAAHIKDALAFLRVADNESDAPAWQRLLALLPGVGPKTAARITAAILAADAPALGRLTASRPLLAELVATVEGVRQIEEPAAALSRALAFYRPLLQDKYPDDYPRREAGLDELLHMAQGYTSRAEFLSDVTLDTPEPDAAQAEAVTLSTVHSAKGLEWEAVAVIDLVEERFPLRYALVDDDALEEERRLLYVACTRARRRLALFAPEAVTTQAGLMPTRPCPFLEGAPEAVLQRLRGMLPTALPADPPPARTPSTQGGMCRHKIFGRGHIVAVVPPDKYRVHFPGFGLKLILQNYVELEG